MPKFDESFQIIEIHTRTERRSRACKDHDAALGRPIGGGKRFGKLSDQDIVKSVPPFRSVHSDCGDAVGGCDGDGRVIHAVQ